MIFIYYFHYDIAYTPLLMGYPTEIFPYTIRSKGLTVELMSVYGSLIILAFVNPIALGRIGWKYYIVFDVLLAIICTVTFFLFPETKGHSLEEIAEVFDGPNAMSGVAKDKATHDVKLGVDTEHLEEVSKGSDV
jgi:hypothetical protein